MTAADQLAREAVLRLADIHRPHPTLGIPGARVCRGCFTCWPCETATIISPAEEAISEEENE